MKTAFMRVPPVSIIIPAYNEIETLPQVLSGLKSTLAEMENGGEIIVVDDGSVDGTAGAVAPPVRLVQHPVNCGHGAAIKSGLRSATHPHVLVFDADGQHDPADVRRLAERFAEGYDLIVGSRRKLWLQHNGRGNFLVSSLASILAGRSIPDLTSGLRMIGREHALRFISFVPDRFCFELTTTMALALNGYKIGFIDIHPRPRQAGSSKIRAIFDGIKFCYLMVRLTWIFKVIDRHSWRKK